MEGPLLCIRGLTIHASAEAGMTEVLRGIDLDLRRGSILGLVGESGSGKSTLGLAAMGYTREGLHISSGSILFDGVDLVRLSEPERRSMRGVRIAYVAQSAAASFNPARRGGQPAHGVVFPPALAQPERAGSALSASCFRRSITTRHDGHGHGGKARFDRLR
jgi:ABC-type glutathione transport system ATPase component